MRHTADALFADSLFHILAEGGSVQDMTARAFLAFRNPILVFDAGFNLIGAMFDENNHPSDEQTRKIIENGGFSSAEYKMASRDRNIHERVLRSNQPIEAYNESLGITQVLCSINSERDLGHIVVNVANHPFTEADTAFLMVFRLAVNEKLRKDEFLRQNKGSNIEYYLKDLLDGKIVTAKRYRDRMDYFKSEFSYHLYCLVIEVARSSCTLSVSHICHLFFFEFPNSVPLIHNGQIIVLLRIPKERVLSNREFDAAQRICLENGLFAGLSNRFSKVLHIQEYWRQALRAIELGIETTTEPALFRYQDYYLHHMANLFLQKESANVYCHPALKLLITYDHEHHTEHAEALYEWLKCERNTSMAADRLKIHRNTMINRMRQITDLLQVDFDDYHERQYLMLSYEILRIQRQLNREQKL